jgi:hypothetical protein
MTAVLIYEHTKTIDSDKKRRQQEHHSGNTAAWADAPTLTENYGGS